jgi:hypothetical protein
MKQALPILLTICLCSSSLLADEPPYSVESTAGIVQQLSKKEYEQPVKEWLKKYRPQQYERLFGEKKDESNKADTKDGGDLFTALAELSAAMADPQIAMLDYYINQKANQGWEVVSISDKIILFRRKAEK